MTATRPAAAAPSEPPVRSALPGAGYALGVLTFINVINYLDRYLVAGILPRIEDTLHIDHAQGGLLQSVFIFVYMLVAPLGGYLGDRHPRRWVLSLEHPHLELRHLGSGSAGAFAVAARGRALVGRRRGGLRHRLPGLIADFFPLSQRTRALSVFYVAIPVGSALGTSLGGWIGNTWSWQRRSSSAGFRVSSRRSSRSGCASLPRRDRGGGASRRPRCPSEGLRGLRSNSFYWVSVAGADADDLLHRGLAVFMPTFLERSAGSRERRRRSSSGPPLRLRAGGNAGRRRARRSCGAEVLDRRAVALRLGNAPRRALHGLDARTAARCRSSTAPRSSPCSWCS
jgi:hypothetical protein